MGTFKDALKKWFFTNGSRKMAATRRVCLLDSSGNPLGSDTIENISKLASVDESKYVDMGLPSGTLWAKYNLGATTETGYGWYFSWGNPDAHPAGAGYDFSQATYSATPAASIDGNLTMSQDAASMILGNSWKMPTKDQFVELLNSNNTEFVNADGVVISGTDKRTTYNGVVGLRIRSKSNGNILFFPAAGVYNGTTLSDKGSNGSYWSSALYSLASAYRLYFGSGGAQQNNTYCRFGASIRPVINK